MTVPRFTIDLKDRTKRLPVWYDSLQERAWSECEALVNHAELFKEAQSKYKEYKYFENGVSYKIIAQDAVLLARIHLGLAKTSTTENDHKKHFDLAIENIGLAARQDRGLDCFNDISKVMDSMVEMKIRELIPCKEDTNYFCADFEMALTKDLLEAAEALLDVFKVSSVVYNSGEYIIYHTETLDGCMIDILDVLVERKTFLEVHSIIGRLLELERPEELYRGSCSRMEEKYPTYHSVGAMCRGNEAAMYWFGCI